MISEEQCRSILDKLSDIDVTAVLSGGPLYGFISNTDEYAGASDVPDDFDGYSTPEKIWVYLKLSAHIRGGEMYASEAQDLADALIRNMDRLSALESAVFAAGLVLLDNKYTPPFLRHIYLQYARIAVFNVFEDIDKLSDTGRCFLKMATRDLLKARSVYKW